jgi:hypothetical protein
MNPTFFSESNPKRWLNGQWIDETEIVHVLIIGSSYVIGEGFEFTRV